jgi:hypothetical protein
MFPPVSSLSPVAPRANDFSHAPGEKSVQHAAGNSFADADC